MTGTRKFWGALVLAIACSPPGIREHEPVDEKACNPRDPWSCRHDRLFCINKNGHPACVPNTCGNGTVEPPEECDGPDAISCASVIGGAGVFSCGNDCRWDYSGCERCGNHLLNGLESCDGSRLADGVSCEDYGYSGGTITCRPSCRPDTASCLP